MKVWRRLVAPLLPKSDRSARVRLRRVVCPCCGQRVWVIVGPPEVADCLESVRCSHTTKAPQTHAVTRQTSTARTMESVWDLGPASGVG